MKTVEGHKVNACNNEIDIKCDGPSHGGASYEYEISINGKSISTLKFQKGPIKEYGVNGITHEALISICVDRLKGFQSSEYSCRENAIALTKLEEAMLWLNKRTNKRIKRGVEGTHEV
jgi:hypothetical protein